jgi:hypothetical protein
MLYWPEYLSLLFWSIMMEAYNFSMDWNRPRHRLSFIDLLQQTQHTECPIAAYLSGHYNGAVLGVTSRCLFIWFVPVTVRPQSHVLKPGCSQPLLSHGSVGFPRSDVLSHTVYTVPITSAGVSQADKPIGNRKQLIPWRTYHLFSFDKVDR